MNIHEKLLLQTAVVKQLNAIVSQTRKLLVDPLQEYGAALVVWAARFDTGYSRKTCAGGTSSLISLMRMSSVFGLLCGVMACPI